MAESHASFQYSRLLGTYRAGVSGFCQIYGLQLVLPAAALSNGSYSACRRSAGNALADGEAEADGGKLDRRYRKVGGYLR